MGVKKNKSLRKQRIIMTLFLILAVLIIIFGILFAYLYSQNYINYGPISIIDKSEEVQGNIVNNSDIIILNNVLIGGVNEGYWISASKMYDKINNLSGIEINMFSEEGNLGKFNTASFKTAGNFYYTTTTKYPVPEEYIAIGNKKTTSIYIPIVQLETSAQDIKNVKNALGKYKLLNGTVNIVEAYQVSFANGELGKIYSVTSDGSNIFGVYSAIVFSYGKDNYLIKYSYVKDTELSNAWPVFDIKHVVDINSDGKYELILQETTANQINYLIEEYVDKGIFNEVLKVSIDIK